MKKQFLYVYNGLMLLILCCFFFNAALQAQNYYVSFAGSGSSSNIDSVIVENITQATFKIVHGGDILHLVDVVGIDPVSSVTDRILVSPNPANTKASMECFLEKPGNTTISLYDVTGKLLIRQTDILSAGIHRYTLTGLHAGMYFAELVSGERHAGCKIIGTGPGVSQASLQYESTVLPEFDSKPIKAPSAVVEMQYNEGDRLKMTGISPEGIAVTGDITTGDTLITFNFISCIDGDQNQYATVQIGNQLWMAENLKTTKWMDGSDIPLITDSAQWQLNRDPAYCWHMNNESAYKNVFGAYYTWYTITYGQLCPNGWHVPTYDDWVELENYLISAGYNYDNTTSGNKIAKAMAAPWVFFVYLLPTIGFTWDPDSGQGVPGNGDYSGKQNASGFSAIPAGFRVGDGSFSPGGHLADFWSSSSHPNYPTKVWYRHLQYNFEDFMQNYTEKWVGFPIRCLKD